MFNLWKKHNDNIQEAMPSLLFERTQQSLNRSSAISNYYRCLNNLIKERSTNLCKKRKHVPNSTNLNAMFATKDLEKDLPYTTNGITKANRSILIKIIMSEYTKMCVGLPNSSFSSVLNAITVLRNLNVTRWKILGD